MRRSFRRIAVVCAALAISSSVLAQPEVTVTLSASDTEVRVGEMIQLEARVRTRGGSIEDLRIDDLQKYPELEIVSHQTMRPTQVSFGFGSGMQVDSSLAHVFVLRPSAAGEYEFSPAVAKVDGKTYQSEPLKLVVRQGPGLGDSPDSSRPQAPPDAPDDAEMSGARYDEQAFVRTVVEPTDAYVGQQVNVTVYLYTRLRLGPQSVVPTKPAMDGFWVYDDPITQLQAQTVLVGGARYQVYPLHRSIAFPQRAGDLEVGAPRVSFDVGGRSFFDAPQRVEREGVKVAVKVEPLPDPAPPGTVVGRYELQTSLDRTTVTTGDALTLRIAASGTGNVQDLRIQLPPIFGVRALQPTIRDDQRLTGGALSGTRTFEWILIAEAPGEHEIPPIEVTYFDPDAEQYGATRTEPLRFTASGATRPSGPALEPANPTPAPAVAELGPISLYSALRRGETPIRNRGWFTWALGIPPFAFALLAVAIAIGRRRERRSTTADAVQRKLVREAEGALGAGDARRFYDRVVTAITHALDTKLEESIGGLSHATLRTKLSEAGFDADLVDRVINELEGADFARFAASGVDEQEMDRCLQRTTTIIERIQRAPRAN